MEFEQIVQQIRERFETADYIRKNQMEICWVKPDRIRMSMSMLPQHLNPHGVLHGGYMVLLADTAAGLAALTDGRQYVTQTQTFSFLRGAAPGVVYAEGRVVHRGNTVVLVHVDVTNEQGQLLGEGTFHMFALHKPVAKY